MYLMLMVLILLGDSYSTLQPKKVEVLCQKAITSFAYGSGPHVLALTHSKYISLH